MEYGQKRHSSDFDPKIRRLPATKLTPTEHGWKIEEILHVIRKFHEFSATLKPSTRPSKSPQKQTFCPTGSVNIFNVLQRFSRAFSLNKPLKTHKIIMWVPRIDCVISWQCSTFTTKEYRMYTDRILQLFHTEIHLVFLQLGLWYLKSPIFHRIGIFRECVSCSIQFNCDYQIQLAIVLQPVGPVPFCYMQNGLTPSLKFPNLLPQGAYMCLALSCYPGF